MTPLFKFLARTAIINFVVIVGFVYYQNIKTADVKDPELSAQVLSKKESNEVRTKRASPTKAAVKKPSSTPTPVSLASQLQAHSTRSDCWLKIGGNIYDITTYFGKHPGGDSVLLKYCGKDATNGFNTKDSIPAKVHSAAASLLLSKYLIQ